LSFRQVGGQLGGFFKLWVNVTKNESMVTTSQCSQIMSIASQVQNYVLNSRWCQWSKNKMNVFRWVQASLNGP